jgi:AcrR family transcriptional regulator
MAVYTRNEIKTAFILLLDERPFTKITVKDVVLKCGVNRNTFYYYFRDLPDLAEAVVEEDYCQVTEGSLDIHTLGDCLDACIRFALDVLVKPFCNTCGLKFHRLSVSDTFIPSCQGQAA